jgi:putative tryptophan/tyrosine transport system substrate-binding protein
MINRRSAVLALGCSVLNSPLIARAQARSGRPFQIGILSTNNPEAAKPYNEATDEGFRDLGYVDGRNILLDRRYARGDLATLPSLAAELVKWPADIIISSNAATTGVLKQATSTIPIVMIATFDPVGEGLIASLSRPGGNITGLSYGTGPENTVRPIQMLKEMVPGLSVLGVLVGPAASKDSGPMFDAAARPFGLKVVLSGQIRRTADIEGAFAEIVRGGCNGFFDAGGSITHLARQQVADLALANRLPGITAAREYAQAGLLITYGANIMDLCRRAPIHVDKILRGAKPADLPVELPTRFDLAINMKTAKALGLTVPQTVRIQATEIIE